MVAAPPINAFKPALRKGGDIELTCRIRAVWRWIRRQRRGTERAGLVAASSAQRLNRQAIDFRINIDPVHCFLNAARDTLSSLSFTQSVHSFRGAKWTDVKKPERRRYLKNAYRVLLKRVRRGMVIFVPPGRNATRRAADYRFNAASQAVRQVTSLVDTFQQVGSDRFSS